MAVPPGRELKALMAAIPAACYEKPAWKGLLYFSRDLSVYLVAVVGLWYADSWLLILPLWILAALGISSLFVVGHDAAHGALFLSKRLSYLVGQAALLPSLHAYEVWAYGHNRLHHGHTGCEGIDFVWHPLTRLQFDALPWWAKLRHRLEWTPWGAGLYYAREVWWNRTIRGEVSRRLEAACRRDRWIVAAFAALFGAGLLYEGFVQAGTVSGAMWMWCKVCFVPWLLWNQTIGAVVYLHHIAPDVPWYSRASWNQRRGQLDATVSYSIPRWLNFFWHNIFLHVPHHVDARIPFYHLPQALQAISRCTGSGLEVRRLRWGAYFSNARRCKLYDFDRGVWADYRGRVGPG